MNRVEKTIENIRGKRLVGKSIDLVPFSLIEIVNVVEIRNRKRNKYFLNQTYELTVEGQCKWYESYVERKNDIYWCIYDKEDNFIGTIRVYDIDENNDMCNQGSFMIDEERAGGAPYALEAEILTLDFIFDELKIGTVINEDRADNKVMNNLSKKIGFKFIKETIINEIEYNYYLLNKEDYYKNREKFSTVVDYWSER